MIINYFYSRLQRSIKTSRTTLVLEFNHSTLTPRGGLTLLLLTPEMAGRGDLREVVVMRKRKSYTPEYRREAAALV
ncbi:hypothetical protein, partial [Brachybacterium sp. Marseille-Q7125]|uniref:hypothetical protein n=1 Tax=Brachybacterium sp. Marseille-Q7125 TaxID=2932815 RepID=UPI001FF4ACD8